jgi:hypothetical protein
MFKILQRCTGSSTLDTWTLDGLYPIYLDLNSSLERSANLLIPNFVVRFFWKDSRFSLAISSLFS